VHTDDELLAVLGRVLTTGAPSLERRPSAAEQAAFERVVAGQLAPRRARRRLARWAVALTAAGSVTMAGSALASALDVPSPLGAVAQLLGIDRGDPDVHAARSTMDELREALQSRDLTSARKAAVLLNARLARLDSGDLARVRDEAAKLVAQEQAMERAGGSPGSATTAPEIPAPADASDPDDGPTSTLAPAPTSPSAPSTGPSRGAPTPTTAQEPPATEPPTTEPATPDSTPAAPEPPTAAPPTTG
jgi:hypothetical protein